MEKAISGGRNRPSAVMIPSRYGKMPDMFFLNRSVWRSTSTSNPVPHTFHKAAVVDHARVDRADLAVQLRIQRLFRIGGKPQYLDEIVTRTAGRDVQHGVRADQSARVSPIVPSPPSTSTSLPSEAAFRAMSARGRPHGHGHAVLDAAPPEHVRHAL
jgi:hypothetical protein